MGVSFSSDEKKENETVDAKSTARQEATTRRRSSSVRSSNTPNSSSWTIDGGEWESAENIAPSLSPMSSGTAVQGKKTEKRKD